MAKDARVRAMTDPSVDQLDGPHSDDAERIVLGSLMLHPSNLAEVAHLLGTGHFYRPHHGAIYAAITSNAASGAPTDAAAIALTFAEHGQLAAIGGAGYLHTLIASVPSVGMVGWYARRVAEFARRRRIQEVARRLLQVAEQGNRKTIDAAWQAAQADMATAACDDGPAWSGGLVDGATFILDIPNETPTVWGRGDDVLWAAGEALIICGPQGVGKTTLAGQLVMARLGLLPDVLGYPMKVGARRVLYLAMDRPQQAARSLKRLAKPAWRDTLADRLSVWKGPPPADVALNPTMLLDMCRAAEADTVVIDSIKDAAVGLSKDEIGAGYNRARQTAIAAGVEVLELHHQRKETSGGSAPKTLADVYGSTWITSGAGSVVLLWGEAGDPVVELRHLKQPCNEVGPINVIHDQDAGTSKADTGDRTRDLLYQAARTVTGMTPQMAASILFKATEARDVEKARRRLAKLVEAGVMISKEVSDPARGGRPATVFYVVEQRYAS